MNVNDKLLLYGGVAAVVFSAALFLFSWIKDCRDRERQRKADEMWKAMSKNGVDDWKKSDSDQEPFEVNR